MRFENLSQYKGAFFKVLGGTELSQLAVMTIPPGGDSGYENAHTGDQVVYVFEGEAKVSIENERIEVQAGDAIIIPKGAKHIIENAGDSPLYFLNIYTPPQY